MITRPDLTDAEELKRPQAIEVAARNLIAALDKLDDGCRHPGFRGFHNGNGEPCGDEAQSTREALAALLVNTEAQRAAVGGPTGAQS